MIKKSVSLQDSSLIVSVKSPDNVLFEGLAEGLSSVNEQGPFDILPQHANFISLVKSYVRIYQRNGQIREIPVDAAVLKVYRNSVFVYLGI